MKTIITGAMALLLAAPAFAQATAPAADPHAGHAQHQGMDHSKMDHSKMDHSKMDHSKMDHSKHAEHKAGHDCAKCCEEAKASGKPMECGMDKPAAKAAAKPDAHQH